MTHREEKTFSISLHLSADFGDDYTGDDDGFAWHERFQRSVRPQLVAAVYDALRADPKFHAVAAPRGRDPEVALDLEVSFDSQPRLSSG
ncbi:MAG TPA: hypothetical protein VK745_22180 [Polyangiaceae bacterium]|nr:hypothetical protein [Polyangiaceae bacterium]